VVLYSRGDRSVVQMKKKNLLIYPLCLLLFYPLVPIALTIAYLVTKNEKHHERATMSKFFSGFLDHGPQFVLRLVVVVLIGLSQGGVYHRDDYVFILSMVTSFLAFMWTALWFNERESNFLRWFFLSGPMYAAIFACRAFTLAVFLRETLYNDRSDALLAVVIIVIMVAANVTIFRVCGQDWVRSLVFGLASLLLPAGYNNDGRYYQLPLQDITRQPDTVARAPRLRRQEDNQIEIQEGQALSDREKEVVMLTPMKSTKFLIYHVLFNTVLMSACSTYLFLSPGDLGHEADDALVIPQLLGVVPGLLFGIGRCLLMPDCWAGYDDDTTTCQRCTGWLRRGGKIALAVIFSVLGILSLIPALFWTFIYKWFTSIDVKSALIDYAKD